MHQINLGDNASALSNTIVLSIQQGATVNVANSANSLGTVQVQSNGLENGPVSTITPGSNASFSVGNVWLSSSGGISSLTLTGTGY